MATLIPNAFASYQLSQSEEEAGQIFNLNQKMVLQNKLALIADEKINLLFDTNNPQLFIQREAELTGQMNIIKWLLDTSNAVEEDVAIRLRNSSETETPHNQ